MLVARNTTVKGWNDALHCVVLGSSLQLNGMLPEEWLIQVNPLNLKKEDGVSMKFVPRKGSGIVGVEFVPYYDVNDEWFTTYPCIMD